MAVPFSQSAGSTMRDRELSSIDNARELLGISGNTMYSASRPGELSSVVIDCQRCISAAVIEECIQASAARVGRSPAGVRERRARRQSVPPPIRARASARAAERGHFAILPSPPFPPSIQKR